MHHAPSVSYPVGRSVFQRRWVWIHGVLTVCLGLAWAVNQEIGWAWMLAMTTLTGVTYCLWRQWRAWQQAPHHLLWLDGVWSIQRLQTASEDPLDMPLPPAMHCVGSVKPVWDGQSTLLLRWQSTSDRLGSGVRWLWLDETASPAQWLDLRRAVYSSLR